MFSFGTLSTVLVALVSITNAYECQAVMCMLYCPYGFDTNASGCPICSCRQSSRVCLEPVFGYNCGNFDHRDCPSSHECHLDLSGFSGQCCLKSFTSATTSPRPTTRPATGTTGTSSTRPTITRPTTTRFTSAATTVRSTTPRPTTPHSTITRPTTTRPTTRRAFNRVFTWTTGSASGAPVSTTASSITGSSSPVPVGTTQSWFRHILPQWFNPQ